MALLPPAADWYEKKIAKDEKMWIVLSVLVCLIMFAWMIIWHVYGKQNPSSVTYRTTPREFSQLCDAFNKKYQVGEDQGIPVVMPPAGGDVFLMAQMWRWSPVLILKKDQWYNFHISSLDLLHGFSLQPTNMNFMVYPNYDYVLKFKPNAAGEYKVICNEFCGVGHHTMIGKIVVIESESELGKYGYSAQYINTSAPPGNEPPAAPLTEEELAAKGAELYKSKACNACHSVDGSKLVGPTWQGVYGSTEKVMADGSETEVQVNDEYIRESILTPNAKLVKDYPASMQPQVISEDEIKAITAYIKSLK
ncbi:MAG: c-type cytochrome [Bacteroidota bacterium]